MTILPLCLHMFAFWWSPTCPLPLTECNNWILCWMPPKWMLNNIRELIPNKRPSNIREFIQKTFIIKFIRKIRELLSNGMLNIIITLILRTAPNTIREFIPNKIFFSWDNLFWTKAGLFWNECIREVIPNWMLHIIREVITNEMIYY